MLSRQDQIAALNRERLKTVREIGVLGQFPPNPEHINPAEKARAQRRAELKYREAVLLQQLADLDFYPPDYSEPPHQEPVEAATEITAKKLTPTNGKNFTESKDSGRVRKRRSLFGIPLPQSDQISP